MSSSHRADKVYVPIEQVRYISDQLLEQLEFKIQTILPANKNKNKNKNKGSDNDNEISLQDDPIRREISLNLQEYLKLVVDQAAYSLVISNMDISGRKLGDVIGESQAKYLEPFDVKLNEEVRQKYQEWEDYSVQVSQIRQRAPDLMNEIYRKGETEYLNQLDKRINKITNSDTSVRAIDENIVDTNFDALNETELCESLEESIKQLHESIDKLPQLREDVTTLNKWAKYYTRHK
ncbi:MIND complex subunit NSL1 PWA37_000469 [Arxiozyma heterogenica]|uniref:Uncharacterized protein n=1 Tax=Arxiozyma heterogenica TaxID=278026 RepID=A0AAN7WJX7_9SACH|nr:hypothetical protein RI543_003944 [Kazachstania heterogenica]